MKVRNSSYIVIINWYNLYVCYSLVVVVVVAASAILVVIVIVVAVVALSVFKEH